MCAMTNAETPTLYSNQGDHPNPLTQRRCPQCDQIFNLLNPKGRGKKPIYCSARCRLLGANHRFCPVCDDSFPLDEGQAASTTFCSPECVLKHRTMSRANSATRRLVVCRSRTCSNHVATESLSKTSNRPPEFCSQTCLNDWRDAQITNNPDFLFCAYPGCDNKKITQDHLLRTPQKYCSQKCRTADHLETHNPPPTHNPGTTRIPAKLTAVKGWTIRGYAWHNHTPHLQATKAFQGRDDWPFEKESEENQKLILMDGWTPETYATVPGNISPALWRKIWGVPNPDDPPMDHIYFDHLPVRWLKKINDFRADNNQPPLETNN